MNVFTFKDRETFMLSHTDELNAFYRKNWDIDGIELVYDKARQTKGIDKILHLTDGTQLNIDEKIESIKETNNIVFEDKTNIATDTSGWLKEGQLTDYEVFYQVNMKKVYVIPFNLMLKQLEESREAWLNLGYERIITNKTENGYYRSRIFLVPKPEVLDYLQKYGYSEGFEYNFPEE